jgi:hypothetical protein
MGSVEVDFEPAPTVGQRNYYEHIIRSGYEIERIRKYIYDNPGHF